MIRRVITIGGVAFLLFFIVFRPAVAQDVLTTIGGAVKDIAGGLGDFFSRLTGGG